MSSLGLDRILRQCIRRYTDSIDRFERSYVDRTKPSPAIECLFYFSILFLRLELDQKRPAH